MATEITGREIREDRKIIETANYNCYEFFLKNTERYGDYDAVQHMGKRYKRSELIRDIEALAYYFSKVMRLKRGDVYAVFCPTNIESLAAFYALNKLGIIVHFVHPLLPTEVMKEAVLETGAKGIMILDILSKDHVKTINELGLPCVLCRCSDYAAAPKMAAARVGETLLEAGLKFNQVDRYCHIIKKFAGKTVPGVTENSGDIATYMNGGGTTGKSKTIKLTNKAINEITFKLGYIDQIEYPGEEAEIAVLPLFHCFGLCICGHMTLCNAARLIPLMRFDGKLVVKLYKKNNIVGIGGIPNMFKKLMRTKGFDGPHLGNTRMMFIGGDDLSPTFLNDFNSMLDRNGTSARLRQGYGMTETCSVCSVNTNWDFKDGSIGKPLTGLRMEIWDDDKNPLPNGEIGEIVVSGSTLMEGYLTKDGPVDAGLYTDDEGTKWVLSGDLGYRDDDGFFFFSGRKKRVIIISGYNVYPVDIENLVEELDFIKECCAVRGLTDGRVVVRLYISLKKQGDVEEYKRKITQICSDNLSKFSVPREIVIMDELPHTPLEKVDFMALQQ